MMAEVDREIHEIHKRVDGLVGLMKWAVGLSVPLLIAALAAAIGIEGRLSSLETTRDGVDAAIGRIDRNLHDLNKYLMEVAK